MRGKIGNTGRRRLLLVAAFTAGLAGCSSLTPFTTGPRGAQPGVKDPGPRVAICYNALKTSPEKLLELAQAQCFNNSVPERVDTDYLLEACPVLTPGRATFVCKPAK
jgi:hypothetical protein